MAGQNEHNLPPVQKSEKMDVEFEQSQQLPRKTTIELGIRPVLTKSALFNQPIQSKQSTLLTKQTAAFEQPIQSRLSQRLMFHHPMANSNQPGAQTASFAPQQSQIFPAGPVTQPSVPAYPSYLAPPQAALANPLNHSAPPLFVGFLTNDVSLGQIKNLFTTYTSACNQARDEARINDKKRKHRLEKKAGRFDLRDIDSSSVASEQEEENTLGKRNIATKVAAEKKAAQETLKVLDPELVKKGAVRLKSDNLPTTAPAEIKPTPPTTTAPATSLFGNQPDPAKKSPVLEKKSLFGEKKEDNLFSKIDITKDDTIKPAPEPTINKNLFNSGVAESKADTKGETKTSSLFASTVNDTKKPEASTKPVSAGVSSLFGNLPTGTEVADAKKE
jgi:hypothetical protein